MSVDEDSQDYKALRAMGGLPGAEDTSEAETALKKQVVDLSASPLWCGNDEPHDEHQRYNDYMGIDYCSGRPAAPVQVPTPEEIAQLWSPALVRKYPERAFDVMTRLTALAQRPPASEVEDRRMPEDVKALLAEARAIRYARRRDRSSRPVSEVFIDLAAALEAAYPTKKEG